MLKTFVVKEVHLSPGLLFPSWEEQLSGNDRAPLWSSHLSSLIDVYILRFLSRIHLSGHYVWILANLCLTFKPSLLFSFHGFVTPFRIRIRDPFTAKSKHAVKSWILQEFYDWIFQKIWAVFKNDFLLSSFIRLTHLPGFIVPYWDIFKKENIEWRQVRLWIRPFLFQNTERLDQL